MTESQNSPTIARIDPAPLFDLLGDNGEHWVQRQWTDGYDGLCLHGAIRRCQPVPGDAYLIEQVANAQGWGSSWNDATDTTWAAVEVRISAGIEITDEALRAVFGPQWQQVVALVRRAAKLTAGEAQQLGAARRPGCDSAGGAVQDAVWHAQRSAAWRAAGSAAGDAAWHAVAGVDVFWAGADAADAAWNAAGALAARDLVGQHGFTRKHYDTLMGAWVTVIG